MESVAGDRAVLAYDHDEDAAFDGSASLNRSREDWLTPFAKTDRVLTQLCHS
jgi:hypothetical protein